MISNYLVYCVNYADRGFTREELIALNRDHLGREDPDALLNGFFPVWAAIQFLVACKLLHNERKRRHSNFYFRFLLRDYYHQSCLLFPRLQDTGAGTCQTSSIDFDVNSDVLFFS